MTWAGICNLFLWEKLNDLSHKNRLQLIEVEYLLILRGSSAERRMLRGSAGFLRLARGKPVRIS